MTPPLVELPCPCDRDPACPACPACLGFGRLHVPVELVRQRASLARFLERRLLDRELGVTMPGAVLLASGEVAYGIDGPRVIDQGRRLRLVPYGPGGRDALGDPEAGERPGPSDDMFGRSDVLERLGVPG